MANEVKLTLKVDDNGSLAIVAKEAKSAAGATDKLAKSSEKLNRTRNNYNKVEKGVGQAGLSTAKGFSKQASTISGGLVPAYAVLAANIFAITAAFNALSRVASLETLRQGLVETGLVAGQNLPAVARGLQEITDLALSAEDAMRSTALAVSAGFSTDQLEQLTRVAQGAAKALGRNLSDAQDRLVRGTAKVEPEILDELGIIVRLDEAVQNYAIANGKAVNSLTQFDRSQAFLNATIEQGEKKFGDLNKAVEENQFNKLEAAFTNLSKSFLGVIANVLTPVVELLSSSPTALFGALAAFSSGLINSILPSLASVAQRQREISVRAIAASKKAGTEVSKEYLTLSRNINKMEFAPPSVRKLENDFEKGTVNATKLTRALGTTKGMITKKENAIVKLKGKTDAASIARVKQLKEEIRLLNETKRGVQAVIDKEKDREGISKKGARLRTGGRMSRRESAYLSSIDQGGLFAGLGTAAKGAGKQFKEIGKATGGLGKLSAAYNFASSSSKLFGSAILRFIPFVGIAITVLSSLTAIFNKLFPTSALEKATDAFADSMSHVNDVSAKLKLTLQDTTNATDSFAATMTAQAGIFETLASSGVKMLTTTSDAVKAEQEKIALKIVELEKDLMALPEGVDAILRTKVGRGLLGFINRERTQKEIEQLQEEIRAAAQIGDEASKKALAESYQTQLAIINATGNLVKGSAAADGVAQLETVIGLLNDPDATNSKILTAIRAIPKETTTAAQNLKNLPDALAGFNKEVQKATQKTVTPFERIADAARVTAQTIRDASSSADDLSDAGSSETFADTLKDAGKVIATLAVAGVDLSKTFEGATSAVEVAQRAFDKLADEIERSKEAAEQAKISIEKQKAIIKDLTKFGRDNAVIQTAIQDARAQTLQDELTILQNKRLEKGLIDNVKDKLEAIAIVDAEIVAKNLEVNRLANERATVILIAELEGRKKLNQATEKALKLEDDILKARLKIDQARAKMAAAQSNVGVSAAEELRIFKDESAERKKSEKAIFLQRLQGIQLEFGLLKARSDLELIKLQGLAAEGKLDDKQLKNAEKLNKDMGDMLDRQESAALTGAAAAVGIELTPRSIASLPKIEGTDLFDFSNFDTSKFFSQTDATEAGLQQKATEEGRKKVLDQIERKIQRQTALGNTSLALAAKQAKIDKQRENITADIASIKENKEMSASEKTIQIALQNAKLDKLRTEELGVQSEYIDHMVGRLESVGGEGAGVLGAFVGEVMKMSQSGGPFSKDFEGTFSERIGKMAEAFDPLFEQMKKLGPDGEIVAAIGQGALAITEAFTFAFENFGETLKAAGERIKEEGGTFNGTFAEMNTKEKMGTLSAGFAAAGATLGAVNEMLGASSRKAIGAIDDQIAREKERDGKSAGSLKKIEALEKKKDALGRKRFEQNKKMQMAQVVMNTAAAVTGILASESIRSGFIGATGMAMLVAAMGAAQLAMIASTSYQGGGSISKPSGGTPKSVEMGKRSNVVDVSQRASGGELAYLRGQRGSGTNANDFTPAFYGSKKMRAAGGAVAGYTVGEQGPELFVPRVPGQIVPNDDVAPAQPISVNFNVQAIDSSSFNDALTVQRGNIISIIREAANGSGEGFLETVDIESLKMER